MTNAMEKIRNSMYGGKYERFCEIITYLTDPTVDGDDIPPSICEDDIRFALDFRKVHSARANYGRTELAKALEKGDAYWTSNLDEWSNAYYCYSLNLRAFLSRFRINPAEYGKWYCVYDLDSNLLSAIAQYTGGAR